MNHGSETLRVERLRRQVLARQLFPHLALLLTVAPMARLTAKPLTADSRCATFAEVSNRK